MAREANYEVLPLKAAQREAAKLVKGLPKSGEAYAFLMNYAKYLRFWPLTRDTADEGWILDVRIKDLIMRGYDRKT